MVDETAPPNVEVIRDDRGYYWRPERDEARRSGYYATKAEAAQAAKRWLEQELEHWRRK
jgi:hypothetical protein